MALICVVCKLKLLVELQPCAHVSDVVFIFQGELNGHRGLVPSNFLQALPEDAQPAPEPKRESQVALHFCLFSLHCCIWICRQPPDL